jgi:glycine cleavage system regulatory protein
MNMPEHAWILENLESYTAGGLEPAERERLEQHVATCPACARALEQAQAVDRMMEGLFVAERPDAALEDNLIRSLRTAPRPRPMVLPISMAAAAVLLFGIIGATVTASVAVGELTFPQSWFSGTDRMEARNNLKQLPMDTLAYTDTNGTLPQENLEWMERRQISGMRDGTGVKPKPDSDNATATQPSGAAASAGQPGVAYWNYDNNWSTAQIQPKSFVTPSDSAALEDPARGVAIATNMWSNYTEFGRFSPPSNLESTGKQQAAGQGKPLPSAEQLAEKSSENILHDLGYYPPARALVLKDASKTHTNLGVELQRREKKNVPTADSDERVATKPSEPAISADDKATLTSRSNQLNPQRLAESQVYSYRNETPSSVGHKRTSSGSKSSVTAGNEVTKEAEKAAKEADREGKTATERTGSQFVTGLVGKVGRDGKEEARELNKTQRQDQPVETRAIPRKIIIRSGEIEFEIESFDSAVAAVTKLVNDIKGGFVATVNSEKLPNGKVRGSVVVRVPPEHLDTLLLDLRKELGKGGELKNLRVGSQDITKQYTDLESRLRAARTMEERLLQIIKAGKGEIKDLLQAEKELGIWRTKIEELEGELRYYGNLVALSTLTITLYEREIRAPFAVVQTERVQMGLEVEDVDKAQQQVLAAVADAKGRVTKSELKQHGAGQFSALLHFEVAPDAAGPLRDRLRQLGSVTRLEIDRLQQTEGGTGRPQDAKSKRNDAQFFLSLYNVAGVAPRETVHLNLACVDTEAVYRKILARVEKSAGRVVTSSLNRQKGNETTGTIHFEIKSAEAEAVLRDVKEAGEVLRLDITENPDTQNVTRSKRGFEVQLWALGQVAPRETAVLQVVTRDVPAGYRALQEAVEKARGRVISAQLNEQDKQNITAQLDFDIRRADEAAIDAAVSKVGDTVSRSVTRAQESENVLDSKVRLQVSLINLSRMAPRENVVLGIEVANVDATAASLTSQVAESRGRVVEAQIAHERSGRVTAKLVFVVPLAASGGLVEKFQQTGIVRVRNSSRNPQVPESPLAMARLDVTLSNAELIVPSDDGLWPQIRKGLSTSFIALSWSLTVVIVGVCFVLPWAVVAYAIYWIVLRFRRRTADATTAA